MSTIHAVRLSPELLKVFEVAQGKVSFGDLTEDEITNAGICLAQVADNDSIDALLNVLPSNSRSLIEARLSTELSKCKPRSTAADMYWIYDTLTFFKHNVVSSEQDLDSWFKGSSGDRLSSLGLSKNDFEFLLRENGKPLDEQTHKARVDIGKKYFTLLLKVAQAEVELNNDIVSTLFLLEFGRALNFEQVHHKKPNEGIRLSEDSPEYKGFVSIVKKVLTSPSGKTTV